MIEHWRKEWLAAGGVFFLIATPFALNGKPLIGLLLATFVYLLRTIYYMVRLTRWLTDHRRHNLPETNGIWGGVFNELYKINRDQQRETDQLRSVAQQLQEAMASLSQAVVITSALGEIQWCNTAAQKLLGLRYPEDQNQLLSNLWRAPAFVSYFGKALRGKSIELASPVNANKTLRVEISEYGAGNKLIFVRDLSATKRLERMRSDFVANISHELRTPLTVISGYVENLLLTDVGQAPVTHKALEQMRTQSLRMEGLLEDLLLLSRLESVPTTKEAEKIHLGSMLNTIREEAEVRVAQGVDIIIDVPETVALLGDTRELYSAFSNLVTNACKYTNEGGSVAVSWRTDEDSGVLVVEDSGIGISDRDVHRITERFYRVDKGRSIASGGTGLGLAITKHVLLRHDAKLLIASQLGVGSSFKCQFPITRVAVF